MCGFSRRLANHARSIIACQQKIAEALALINIGHIEAAKRLLDNVVRAIDEHVDKLDP